MSRIYLSPPDVGPAERALLLDAFDSGWIAPVGPHLGAFEMELAAVAGVAASAALSSGTAGLHLALHCLGVGPGDDVLLPTLTFAATANAVAYVGARPVFVDAEPHTGNVDPDLVADELERRQRAGTRPAAVVTVDLYGQCAGLGRVEALCAEHGVPLVEDAAEAVGATHGGRAAGSFGRIGVFSFNGNKIVTCSGGGAVVSDDVALIDRVRHLATQARQPVLHYEHEEVGFNYRLSNLLAAVGRGQLARLPDLIASRRANRAHYEALLGAEPGIGFLGIDPDGASNHWLTCITVDADRFGADAAAICSALDAQDIEARPLWKPMHLQPAFAGTPTVGGSVAEQLYEQGVCLPSGSALTAADRERVAAGVMAAANRLRGPQGHRVT